MKLIQTKRKIQRQEKILSRLGELGYATLEQLRIIEDLGGYANAHRIIHEMEKEKLIGSVRFERKVYYLSSSGQERIGKEHTKLKQSWIRHTLMRNDLFIELGMPDSWEKERPVYINDDELIPDARFKFRGEYHFVEIDNTQTMKTNVEKIKKYKLLSKAMFQKLNHTPTLIWYSLSDVRKEKLKSACEKYGVKYKIV